MTTVLKIGGELILPENTDELGLVVESIHRLRQGEERILVVHGGGPQTTQLMSARGIRARLIGGRRVTDSAALDALLMAVGGEANIRLTSALVGAGIDAVGLNGVSKRCITCARLEPGPTASAGGAWTDYGFVGEVTRVDLEFLELFFSRGMVPVLACIGSDGNGRPLNVNADALAHGVASALRAERLVFVTGAPGVLRDPNDLSTRQPRLSIEEGRAAIASGAILGGMIAKLEEAFLAIEAGVSEVHILGQLSAGDIERAFAAPGSVGTVLHA